MNKIRHILSLLPVAMLLAACSQDDLADEPGEALPEPIPLQLTAAIGEGATTPASRAGTVDGQWPDGATVYVQISDTENGLENAPVLAYIVDTSGNLTPSQGAKTVYWERRDQSYWVRAWYPGGKTDWNGIPKQGGKTWTAEPDQSTAVNLAKGDFLFAYQKLTFGSQTYTLQFRHLMSKIIINLVNSPYLKQYDPGDVSVSLITTNTIDKAWCVGGSFEGSGSGLKLSQSSGILAAITPFRKSDANEGYYASYEAIVIPQGVDGTCKGIEVKVGNATYRWSMMLGQLMYSGNEYTFNITVDAKGLQVSAGSSISWGSGSTGSGSVTLP